MEAHGLLWLCLWSQNVDRHTIHRLVGQGVTRKVQYADLALLTCEC